MTLIYIQVIFQEGLDGGVMKSVINKNLAPKSVINKNIAKSIKYAKQSNFLLKMSHFWCMQGTILHFLASFYADQREILEEIVYNTNFVI